MKETTHQDWQEVPQPKKPAIWQKVGGGALMIAIVIHLALALGGAFWIAQRIFEPEKKIDFMPGGSSGGGGERSAQTKVQQKKRSQITPSSNVKRVFAEGASSNFALPDPGDSFSEMNALSSLDSGSLGGFGGAGNSGAFGGAVKADTGAFGVPGGMGIANPFGMVDPNANALKGTFYDLKQTKNRNETDMSEDSSKSNDLFRAAIREFVNSGWKERFFSKYYQAPITLNQTKFFMPIMNAELAPEAFECEKEVKPQRWVVVYRGIVTPPKTGRYRFVGAADDVLVVRFDGKHVLDYGYTSGTLGKSIQGNVEFFNDTKDDPELKKLARRDFPMEIPVQYYDYLTTQTYTKSLGGLALGVEFDAVSGRPYPIEILISEIPGGFFSAVLMIEEIGANYQKDSKGAPILPIFRLDQSLPAPDKRDNTPPFDPGGPVWKRVVGASPTDI